MTRREGWLALGNEAPEYRTEAYVWWSRGAADERYYIDEGLTQETRELRELVEALGRIRPDMTVFALVGEIAKIYGWEIRDAGLAETRRDTPWQRIGEPPTPTSEVPVTSVDGEDNSCSTSSETENSPPVTTVE